MSKCVGMCDLLKSHEKDEIFCEVDYCPRVLSEDEMRLLLGSLACKLRSFSSDLEVFLNNPDFSKVDISEYFYFYYRKIDTYCYWGNLHLQQVEERA